MLKKILFDILFLFLFPGHTYKVNMNKFPFILFIIVYLLCCQAFAQQNAVAFKHLTLEDGLSQNSVNCILQDKNGFMWFGTHDGLNRYDGYQFIHYRTERNNKNSLSNNYITDLYEDDEGVLWITTFGGGLNSLNTITGEINRIHMISEDSVLFPTSNLFSITEYPKGTLWIGGGEGLIRLDKKTFRAKIFLASKSADDIYEFNYIGTIIPSKSGVLWLQSNSGLTSFNTTTFTEEHFKKSPFSASVEMGTINDLFKTDEGFLIACTAGLFEINVNNKTDTLLLAAASVDAGDLSLDFQRILPVSKNHFAIGTKLGLIIFNAIANKYTFHQHDALDEKSLSHNNILSLLKSREGISWIGTRNGINILETETPNFIHIRNIPGKNSLSSKNVSSFAQLNDSLFWIGTTDGLNLFNVKSNACAIYRKEDNQKNSLKSNYILCLFKDSKENTWVGTRGGGFYKIEINSDNSIAFKQILPLNDYASPITVHCIAESTDGYIWLGTGGNGLWRYDPDENSMKKYGSVKDGTGLNHTYVFKILEDPFHNLWLGTPSGGLNLFDRETEKFIYFQNNPENDNSINNDIILSLYQDDQNTLWVGTNDGLAKFIPKLSKNIFHEVNELISGGSDSLFSNFGVEQGFPNSVIYGMLEDDKRNLWISTNKGLAVFNMDTEQVIKTYDVSDGLQSNEFNQNAYYKSKEGPFYFGGVNGVNIFHPGSITENSFIPPVVITQFYLFNEPVKVGNDRAEEGFYLEKEIHALNEIDLLWKHNVLTFEFTALSYISPEKNQFSYKLEGFNDKWVDAGHRRSATYTHLDPGNYIFRVKASNNSGVWNETGTSLKIHISAPPWLSWYAYLIYIFLFLLSAYLFVRFRIKKATRDMKVQNQIEKAREQEREVFRKKSAADFHDEAGNKITKITLFTELARSEINNKTQLENYLDKIQLNISELSSGMRDFLWVMDPKHDSLFETLSRLKDFGDSILTETGVSFIIHGMKPEFHKILLSMNTRRDLLQIFKEAMNNCAKYAAADQVALTTFVSEDFIQITLSDNGKGFDYPGDKKNNKYGLSIMQERAKKIGAELSIQTEINKGTTISLKCNMPHLGNS
ncbi:MAG: hypothetical protein K9H49_05760 [Bacteroidales bacterium]|nr:hypothetical protein [Bacteroidales bacterium]MCF8404386.1 hypothetical protein [Bacteroidales bacterium]